MLLLLTTSAKFIMKAHLGEMEEVRVSTGNDVMSLVDFVILLLK